MNMMRPELFDAHEYSTCIERLWTQLCPELCSKVVRSLLYEKGPERISCKQILY